MKKEILIVAGVLIFVLFIPVIAIASVTDIAALASQSVSLYSGPTYVGDTYDYGQCTYWAALQRAQIDHPIPNNWGNANTWAKLAATAGYVVDHTPAIGAIMQTTDGQFGHVAYVDNVTSDGRWEISEMNYKGWDEVDNRTFSITAATDYSFIH